MRVVIHHINCNLTLNQSVLKGTYTSKNGSNNGTYGIW